MVKSSASNRIRAAADACRRNDLAGAVVEYTAVLEEDDEALSAAALFGRAICRHALGHESEAIADLCSALERRSVAHRAALVSHLGEIGGLLATAGRLRTSVDFLMAASSAAESSDPQTAALFAAEAGRASMTLHQAEYAHTCFLRALELEVPAARATAIALCGLAEEDISQTDLASARVRLTEAMALQPTVLPLRQLSATVRRFCLAAVRAELFEDAQVIVDHLADVTASATPSSGRASRELLTILADAEALQTALLHDRAQRAQEKGQRALAVLLSRTAAATLGPRHTSPHVVAVRLGAASAALAFGSPERALADLEEAVRHVRTRSERQRVAEMLAEFGDSMRTGQQWTEAIRSYELAASAYDGAASSDTAAAALAAALHAAAASLRRRVAVTGELEQAVEMGRSLHPGPA